MSSDHLAYYGARWHGAPSMAKVSKTTQLSESNPSPAYSEEYFSNCYSQVQFPLAQGDEAGLRRGQLGAIHAIAGHLTVRHDPALVVMPTGSGKTGVLMMVPYLQRSKRVLVVTPSRQVRAQIAEGFETLDVLRRLKVVRNDLPRPRVKELTGEITTAAGWDELQAFNVVVTTPNTISPVIQGIAPAPEGFFDLLLIDEAHHSPAKTWAAVLGAFPKAHKVLFTATPFRRDRREIKASLVFNYPLSEARIDEVFGDITFYPVLPDNGESADSAIAREAAAALQQDLANGLNHRIMIRTKEKKRGETLFNLYAKETNLRLRLIHSDHTLLYIGETLKLMREAKLDGVVCVNMLGEGFDFPNLKIAALHSPHKSLGTTLQFIGRFARVAGGTGGAKFFAVPDEIEGDVKELLREDAEWQQLVINLSEGRVATERDVREQLASFEEPEIAEPEAGEVSLYSLRPRFHVKVYRVPDDVDISASVTLPKPFEIVHRRTSGELSATVLILNEQQKPDWSDQLRFGRTEFDLMVLYYDAAAKLLFINSSRRSDSIYRAVAMSLAGESAKILPLYQTNRVLLGLSRVECFSVGMKNRLHTSRNEAYKMISGRRANLTVRKTDGKLFHRGHIMCKAKSGTQDVTLGYSSASKIWSSNKGPIPLLVRWCQMLAKKLATEGQAATVPGLDHLSVGEPLQQVPLDVLAADWDTEVYAEHMKIAFPAPNGELVERDLLDLDIVVDRSATTQHSIRVDLKCDEETWKLDFRPKDAPFFIYAEGPRLHPVIKYGEEELELTAFLNEYPFHFYFASCGRLRGDEWFPCPHPTDPYSRELIEAIDWSLHNVNIQREFWKPAQHTGGQLSIHDYLRKELDSDLHSVVFYDHRTGEVADFLTVHVEGARAIVTLYHCKGSSGSSPGDRLEDLYEVCGQVIKSFNMIDNPADLVKHVKRRAKSGSQFVRGNLSTFEKLLRDGIAKGLDFRLVAVQPGASRSALTANVLSVLGAANEYVHQLGLDNLRVIGSA